MDFCGGIRARVRVASWLSIAIAGAIGSAAPVAGAADTQILYFEPLRISVPSSDGRQQKTSAGELRNLELNAYGRMFAVSVEANETFHASLAAKPSRSSLKLYRGAIDGLNGSWVRLATKGTDVHGMIWDGEQAYVVAPADEIRDQLVPPLDAGNGTVIFRLSDVLLDTPSMSCSSDDTAGSRRASDAFQSLKGEMQAAAESANATKRLELSVIGDALFSQRHLDAQDARESILIRLNNVDGIFSSQLGVHIQAPAIEVHSSASDPLSGVTNASTLLEELGSLRRKSPELRARGLTHLFTGRNLDGTTVGIGYIDSLCDARYGAGLTEVAHRGTWYESLIAAHEMGHNFGAVHDGQPGKACASTPQGVYLMSPNVNGGETFSQCSRDVMQARIAAASCITPLAPANITIESDLGTVHQPLGTAFEWELPVTNVGGMAAKFVRAEILVPPPVTVEAADVTGGSCTSGAGYTQCTLGTIAGGTSRAVRLRLRSDTLASNAIFAKVFAQNDIDVSDNIGEGTITIDPEADIALNAEAPGQARLLEPFDLTFALKNTAVIEASEVQATIELPQGVVAREASFGGEACAIAGALLTCSVASLAPGQNVAGTASLVGEQPGAMTIRLGARGGYVDPNSANDTIAISVQISTTTTATASQGNSSSSGGGGSTHAALLTLLGALAFARQRYARTR